MKGQVIHLPRFFGRWWFDRLTTNGLGWWFDALRFLDWG